MGDGRRKQCFSCLLCHCLLDISLPDHVMYLPLLLLAFASASACSPRNILPFVYLANSYSSINSLPK